MKKFVLVPDSFKGTLSSLEICRVLREEILRQIPDAIVCEIPVADGGEGTVDALLAAVGGRRVSVPCTGPLGEKVTAFYGLLPDGAAVVEMAAAAGLPLVGQNLHPERATTYGVGELIAHAASHGAKRLVLALGGSATNDGGCGCAAALGVRFLDRQGRAYVPVGGTLDALAHIDLSGLAPAVSAIEVTVMCDIDNPLCGKTGAAAVFGPQKGADAAMVARLDENLYHLAQVIRADLGRDVLSLPGGGAAGGFGAGAVAFLGGTLRMGIDTVLELAHFDEQIRGADLVITGEGKLDAQSLRGKVVYGVVRRAGAAGVPVATLVGGSETELEALYDTGLAGVFPINPLPKPFEEVKGDSRKNLQFTIRNLIHFVRAIEKPSLFSR